MSFPGKPNLRVSSSAHLRQTSDMLSLDSEQLRRERCTSVKRWLLTMLVTKASPNTILSETLSESDLSGLDHVLVRSMIVVQNVGIEFPGVGAHCESIARWRRRGSGDTVAGIEREDSYQRISQTMHSRQPKGWNSYVAGKRQALELRHVCNQREDGVLVDLGAPKYV